MRWKGALAGDRACTRLHAERDGLQALVDKRLRWYPPDHEVILYEAARLPIESPRIARVLLRDLPAAHYEDYTTLVIPPPGRLRDDPGRALRARQSPPTAPHRGFPRIVKHARQAPGPPGRTSHAVQYTLPHHQANDNP